LDPLIKRQLFSRTVSIGTVPRGILARRIVAVGYDNNGGSGGPSGWDIFFPLPREQLVQADYGIRRCV
jgi:hypothetical protein